MWQTCPICNGTGIDYVFKGYGVNTSNNCTTCKGKKIISTLTGLPPNLYKDLPDCSKGLSYDINKIVTDDFNKLI